MTTTTTATPLLWLLFLCASLCDYLSIASQRTADQSAGQRGGGGFAAMDSFAALCNARNALSRWAMATAMATLTTDYSHTPLGRQQTSRGIERRPIEGALNGMQQEYHTLQRDQTQVCLVGMIGLKDEEKLQDFF